MQVQVLAPRPTRQWRRDDRRGNRLGSGAMPQTVERGALGPSSCGGRPKREPVKTPEPRQTEKETDHKQEHEHMKGHHDPRCLKWGEGELASEASIRRVSPAVKRVGEKSELSTTEWGSTQHQLIGF